MCRKTATGLQENCNRVAGKLHLGAGKPQLDAGNAYNMQQHCKWVQENCSSCRKSAMQCFPFFCKKSFVAVGLGPEMSEACVHISIIYIYIHVYSYI